MEISYLKLHLYCITTYIWHYGYIKTYMEKECWHKFGSDALRNEWFIWQRNECTKSEFEKTSVVHASLQKNVQ